jgi:hypothetical protein
MENKPSLSAGSIVHHSHFGKGKIICQFEDSSVGDMVEVHWFDKNEVLDHREENLRFGLTSIVPPATTHSHWAMLADEDR